MSDRHPPRLIRRRREIDGDAMIDTRRALFLVLDMNGENYRERVELRRVVSDLSAASLADSDVRAEINRRIDALEVEQDIWLRYATYEFERRVAEHIAGEVNRAWSPLGELERGAP